MRIIQFGGYTLPTEQYEMSESQGAGRAGSTVGLPGAGGSWDAVGLGPDPLAEDTISKSFTIVSASASALQTAIDAFVGEMMLSQNDWRQGTRLLIGQLPDNTKRATWAKCVEARWTQEYFNFDNYWLGPVNVTWRRSWPVWFDYEDLYVFGDHLGTFADTAALDFGPPLTSQAVSASPTTLTVTNAGNARVTDLLIEFSGVINRPKLENLSNGHWFEWSGSLDSSGDRLTFQTAAFDARKNGAGGEWANMTVGSSKGQLLPMVLEPGSNNLRVTGSGPNCTMRMYWARAWM